MSSSQPPFNRVKRPAEAPIWASSKRGRESVKVIEIDGLPPHISSKLEETIRVAKTFVENHEDDVISPLQTTIQRSIHQNVVESIISRLEQVKDREKAKVEREIQEIMDHALGSLMGLLKQGEGVKISPAVGSLNYLWKMQQHELPVFRRLSLYLSGHILMKNEECLTRWYDGLMPWITSVAVMQNVPDKHAKAMLLWQKEAKLWSSFLVNRFPDSNKLRVAARYLEHKGPSFQTDGVDAFKTMNDWRIIRDIAMAHAAQECEIIEKLVRRSYACIDELMPRIGTEPDMVDQAQTVENAFIGEDDDDDIDWEEGDNDVAEELHAVAVEQTLALMRATGYLRGGDLEISLKNDAENEGGDNHQHALHKRRLQKLINLLTLRHLPCLSTWVNAMTEADNLVETNGSLVLMPKEECDRRHATTQRLISQKQTVAAVVRAAFRLNITAEQPQNVGGIPRNTFIPNVRQQRHEGLSRIVERRRREPSSEATRKRSNRIQVKINHRP